MTPSETIAAYLDQLPLPVQQPLFDQLAMYLDLATGPDIDPKADVLQWLDSGFERAVIIAGLLDFLFVAPMASTDDLKALAASTGNPTFQAAAHRSELFSRFWMKALRDWEVLRGSSLSFSELHKYQATQIAASGPSPTF